MPVPGMKACKFFETNEQILEQWPDLKHLPRPEPDEDRKDAHRKWRKEYSHWKGLKCGNSVGYFCRAHGWWITCVEINANVASLQSEEAYGSCPKRHYDLDELLTNFHAEKEAEHSLLYEQATESGTHAGEGHDDPGEYHPEADFEGLAIDESRNRDDTSRPSRHRGEGDERGYARPKWDAEEWGDKAYLQSIQSDRDDGHGSEVPSVLSSSPARIDGKSKHRHRSSKGDKAPSKSTAESSKSSKPYDPPKRSSKKGRGEERRTVAYDEAETYEPARGSFEAPPSYEEGPAYEFTIASEGDRGDDRHVDYEHDSSRRIPRPQPEADLEPQEGSGAYYDYEQNYARGGQTSNWEEQYTYAGRTAKQKSSRHGKKGTTK